MTEEATNDDPWGPHSQTMASICEAAFQPDDYWRILQVILNRVSCLDKKHLRAASKALDLTEYLLTHGPLRFAQDIRMEIQHILPALRQFQYIDKQSRIDWGRKIQAKAATIQGFLDDRKRLDAERRRRTTLSREIRRGSFSSSSSSCSSPAQDSKQQFSSMSTMNTHCSAANLESAQQQEQTIENWEWDDGGGSSRARRWKAEAASALDSQNTSHEHDQIWVDFQASASALRRRKPICGGVS